jgi:hypothetical protein
VLLSRILSNVIRYLFYPLQRYEEISRKTTASCGNRLFFIFLIKGGYQGVGEGDHKKRSGWFPERFRFRM